LPMLAAGVRLAITVDSLLAVSAPNHHPTARFRDVVANHSSSAFSQGSPATVRHARRHSTVRRKGVTDHDDTSKDCPGVGRGGGAGGGRRSHCRHQSRWRPVIPNCCSDERDAIPDSRTGEMGATPDSGTDRPDGRSARTRRRARRTWPIDVRALVRPGGCNLRTCADHPRYAYSRQRSIRISANLFGSLTIRQ
jgi:hypothetical protein